LVVLTMLSVCATGTPLDPFHSASTRYSDNSKWAADGLRVGTTLDLQSFDNSRSGMLSLPFRSSRDVLHESIKTSDRVEFVRAESALWQAKYPAILSSPRNVSYFRPLLVDANEEQSEGHSALIFRHVLCRGALEAPSQTTLQRRFKCDDDGLNPRSEIVGADECGSNRSACAEARSFVFEVSASSHGHSLANHQLANVSLRICATVSPYISRLVSRNRQDHSRMALEAWVACEPHYLRQKYDYHLGGCVAHDGAWLVICLVQT
jgi:hypothetical protein